MDRKTKLISADALASALLDDSSINGANLRRVIQHIEDAPAVDAEPVKRGRWLPQVLLGERVWDCSECKTIGSPYWKRCPVCEAKMDGGNEDV